VFTWQAAWENSDDTGWHFIANGVQSVSAGRQGISDYVTTGAVAHWHSEAGNLDVSLANGVSQVTAGTDALGNYMIDLLFSNGNLWEYRASGGGWQFLASNIKYLGKAHNGVLDVVTSFSDAFDHDSSWHFLAGGAVAAA
jgi:hypothetical protein